jgi:glycosyltransferase involved in cell wall biosynthesis
VRLLLLAHAPVVHTQRWARALAERGHEIRLLTAEVAPGAAWPGRAVGARLPVSAFRYASARGAVRRELRGFRPDATVAHFLPNYGFLAALAGARPLFLVCWGSDLLVNAWRTPLHRFRARWVLSRADLVHVDAPVLSEAAARLGASATRIWTRAWGVDTDALAPAAPWPARRARAEAVRILWTRQLRALYGPETFLRALARLRDRGVPFQATVAGDGPLRSSLEAQARREGIADRVRFEGWLGEEALRALYRSHEIFVSLSRSDSTSQSLLEAMAAGLVPVVSDLEGNREWVTHRREGYLVPADDAEAVACAIGEIAASPWGRAGAGAASGASMDPLADPAAMAARSREAVVSRARFEDTVRETEARLIALSGQGGRGGQGGGPRA